LTRSGDREGAGAVLQKALALDHSNAILQANYIHHLLRGNQQERAWDQLDFYQQQNPAATTFQRLRAEMLFLVAANAKPWREQTAGTGYQHGVVTATNADDIALYQRFYWSRLDGEYGDMLSVLDAYPRNEVRSIVPASGLHPLAHYEGWLHLLEGDLRAAGRDGADIEDFLGHELRPSPNISPSTACLPLKQLCSVEIPTGGSRESRTRQPRRWGRGRRCSDSRDRRGVRALRYGREGDCCARCGREPASAGREP